MYDAFIFVVIQFIGKAYSSSICKDKHSSQILVVCGIQTRDPCGRANISSSLV